ncbi:MAG: diacylglycerol kinase family lipid kinase [bacterium]|nr:diacylglycerol kinase family lipid kinase [bacterium]
MVGKTALIYNPSAGGGKALRKKKKVETSLLERSISYDLYVTESEEHLIETAEALVHQYPVILSAGGDTTVNIIATQVLRAGQGNTLGIFSLGSVNDLGRELGIFKLDSALEAIHQGGTRQIDVGTLTAEGGEPVYFLVSASLGLGVSVNRYVDIWMRKHPFFSSMRTATQGTAAMTGIHQAFRNKEVPLELSLETEGETHQVVSPLMVFGNTSSFGGFHPSPFASVDSGKIDCSILTASSFAHFCTASLDIKRQKHLKKEKVKVLRSESFKIYSQEPLEFQLDGEIRTFKGEVNISILPKALTVIAPPATPAGTKKTRRSKQIGKRRIPGLRRKESKY